MTAMPTFKEVTFNLLAPCANGEMRCYISKKFSMEKLGYTPDDTQKPNFQANLQDTCQEWGFELFEGHFSMPTQQGETMPETVQFDLYLESTFGSDKDLLVHSQTMNTHDLLVGSAWENTALSDLDPENDELFHHIIEKVTAWANSSVDMTYVLDEQRPDEPSTTPAKIYLVSEILGKVVETNLYQPTDNQFDGMTVENHEQYIDKLDRLLEGALLDSEYDYEICDVCYGYQADDNFVLTEQTPVFLYVQAGNARYQERFTLGDFGFKGDLDEAVTARIDSELRDWRNAHLSVYWKVSE